MANRKKKKQAMSLSEFHATVATTEETAPPAPSRMNWADEMEALDEDSPQQSNFVFDRSKLPTAPKSVRQSEIDLELVPKRPPYKCFLGNISFEADEEKIKNFFRDLKVVNVHLTVDQGGRSKGTGTVEFEDRESLISALNRNENMLNNRALRISLLESRSGFDKENSGRSGFMQRDENEPLKSDESSWRRLPEPEPEVTYPYQNKPNDRYQSDRRGGYGDRGGRYGDRQHHRGGYGGDRGGDRGDRGGYGGDRGDRGGYGGDRGYGGRGGRQEDDRRHYGGYNRGEQRENRNEGPSENAWNRPREEAKSANSTESTLTERPKLQLAPRTLPVEESNAPVASSSIFGSAKPVNTAAREREIEERLKDKQVSKPEDQEQFEEENKPEEVASKSNENPWKSRQSSDLFSGQNRGADSSRGNAYNSNQQQPQRYDDRRGGYSKRDQGARSYNNRDGGQRGDHRGDRRGGNRDNRGGNRNFSDKPERVYKNYNEVIKPAADEVDIGFNNKFATLGIDADDVE